MERGKRGSVSTVADPGPRFAPPQSQKGIRALMKPRSAPTPPITNLSDLYRALNTHTKNTVIMGGKIDCYVDISTSATTPATPF